MSKTPKKDEISKKKKSPGKNFLDYLKSPKRSPKSESPAKKSLQFDYPATAGTSGTQGGTFGAQGGTFGAQGDAFGAQGDAFGAQGDAFGAQGGTFGAQGDAFGAQGGTFGALGGTFGAQGGTDEHYNYIYNVEQSFSRFNTTMDNPDPQIVLEAAGEHSGLNPPPIPFERYISPRKTPMKNRQKVDREIAEALRNQQLSSDEEYEIENSSEVSYVKDFCNFDRRQMSINTSIRTKRRSKTPPKIREKRQELNEYDNLKELFTDAPFPKEAKTLFRNGKLTVSSDFIKRFTSSIKTDDRSNVDMSKNFVPDDETERRMTKPVKYDYDASNILKRGDLQMKRMVLEICVEVHAVLLRNGILMLFDPHAYSQDSQTLRFSYVLQDYLKLRDGNLNLFYIDAVVRDSICKRILRFEFKEQTLRNEWGRAFKRIKKTLASKPSLRNVTGERAVQDFDNFCREYQTDNTMQSYEFVRALGRGAYGKILHCKHKETERHCEIKVMRKDLILENDGVDSVIFQNFFLRKHNHPYLQKLYYTAASYYLVTFVMDYADCGPLQYYVFIKKMFSEQIAVYYGAQMASAILYLHSEGVINRDLNLSNSCLDSKGNLKITDFGFSVADTDKKAYNFHILQNLCYVAPELLSAESYAFSCDWWSFGVCFYNMLTGRHLFKGNTTTDIAFQIINERFDFSSDNIFVEDFLSRILERDPQRRLGCSQDESEILNHEIFLEFLWKNAEGLMIKPPIQPQKSDSNDGYYVCNDDIRLHEHVYLTPPTGQKKYEIYKNDQLKDNSEVENIGVETNKLFIELPVEN